MLGKHARIILSCAPPAHLTSNPRPLSWEGSGGFEDVQPDDNRPVVLRVIEESAEHRGRRERETARVHLTAHSRPLSEEGAEGVEDK